MKNIISPIQSWIEYHIKFHKLSSISLGIIDFNSVNTYQFGSYNIEDSSKADKDSIYCIASLSKIFTAIKILKLEEEGKLSIESKVSDLLSYFPDKETTIKDLLIHTAGLDRDGKFNFWLTQNFPNQDELIEYIKTIPKSHNKVFKYSNLGYAILGLILTTFRENLIQPNNDSIISYGKNLPGQSSKIYRFVDHKSFIDSFGIYKTIDELSKDAQSILKKDTKLLSENTWKKFLSIQLEIDGQDEDDIAFGLYKWKDKDIFEGNGYGFGFASSMLIDFDNKMAYTIVTNCAKESYAPYYTRTIRKFIDRFKDTHINLESPLTGLYRGKDYDVLVYDCGNKLYIFNPADSTPFYEENLEEYDLVTKNVYTLINRPDDPYKEEHLEFELENNNISGFHQGGWGFVKIK